MLALPMGLHLGGCIFLWTCILGVSLYPFSSHHPTLGPSIWANIWSTSGVHVEGLAFLGPWGERGIQTALGAGLKASGYGPSTLPGCSPAYLEWGVQLPESATC